MAEKNRLSEEQQKIVACKGNVVVNARPGSGKTFTIVEKITNILKPLPPHKGIIAISYTNKASDEILRRIKTKNIDLKSSFFGTMDKLYISELIIPFSVFLTGKIMQPIFKKIKDLPEQFQALQNLGLNPSAEEELLINKALQEGYIILGKTGEFAYYIITKVKKAADYIVARYSAIFIDEYQDCGEAQHALFNHLISLGLTGIAVGDLDQAIYGYESKKPDYLHKLMAHDSFNKFNLSKNYRCHKTISDYSLALFNDPCIKEQTKDTRVIEVDVAGDERQVCHQIDKYLPQIIKHYSELCETPINYNQVAILVRNRRTGQLVDSCLKTPHKYFCPTPFDDSSEECDRIFKELTRMCVSSSQSAIEYAESYYSEEYDGKKLKKLYRLVNALIKIDDPITNLKNNIDKFVEIASFLLIDRKKADIDISKLTQVLNDEEMLNSFKDPKEEEINIMTMHAAKGLEYEIVFHLNLCNYEMPSYNSIKGDENEWIQDINLHYVTITRAINVCYLIVNSLRTKNDGQITQAEPSLFLSLNNSLSQMRRKVKWQQK